MPDQNQTPPVEREWVSTTATLADGRRVHVEGHIVPLASSSLPDSGERDAAVARALAARPAEAHQAAYATPQDYEAMVEYADALEALLRAASSSDGGEREAHRVLSSCRGALADARAALQASDGYPLTLGIVETALGELQNYFGDGERSASSSPPAGVPGDMTSCADADGTVDRHVVLVAVPGEDGGDEE